MIVEFVLGEKHGRLIDTFFKKRYIFESTVSKEIVVKESIKQ
jgi:hypothetical protein